MKTLAEIRAEFRSVLKGVLPAWEVRFEGEDLADRVPNAIISIISATQYTQLGYTNDGGRVEMRVSLWTPSALSEALFAMNLGANALARRGYRIGYTTTTVDPERWYGAIVQFTGVYKMECENV